MDPIKTLQKNDTLQSGKYTILSILGQGGFGISYLARHKILQVEVAIKELFLSAQNTYCTRNPGDKTVVPHFDSSKFDNFKQRFLDEAYTLARFKNVKGVVQVIDTFEEKGTVYFVMEYIEGLSIKKHIETHGKFTEKQAVNIVQKLFKALIIVHEKGVLHRDINPNNILLQPNPIDNELYPVLIDFGIAREYEEDVTQTHTTFRTAGYSAPEQAVLRAKRGAYTDIYSIGGTLYFMLTGERPQSSDEIDLDGFKSPKDINSAISDKLNNAIVKAIKKRPADRYQTCEEFAQAIANPNVETVHEPSQTDDDDKTLIDEINNDDDITLVETVHEPSQTQNDKKSGKTKKILIPLAAVAILAVILFLVFRPTDQKAWDKVQAENTKTAYEQYLADYPQGEYVSEAQENIDWIIAQNKNSIIDYGEFIRKHPESEYNKLAKEKSAEKHYVMNTLRMNLAEFREYLTTNFAENLSDKYKQKANEKLSQLIKDSTEYASNKELQKADEEAWKKAKRTGTKEALQKYINKYLSHGKYIAEAKKELNAINSISYGSFTDPRDGKTYKTVRIGTQTWFAENLAYTGNNGFQRKITDNDQWDNNKHNGYCYYKNSSSNGSKYGVLYQWEAAKRACPSGWHLPTDAEWTKLEKAFGGRIVAGKKMKSRSGWKNSGNGTNSSGFNALSGGFRTYLGGKFIDLGYAGYWWTSTPNGSSSAYRCLLTYRSGKVGRDNDGREYGFSVRCVRD